MEIIFIRLGEVELGPFSEKQVKEYLAAGHLLPADPATLDPKGKWDSVEEVMAHLPAAPIVAPTPAPSTPQDAPPAELSPAASSPEITPEVPVKPSEEIPPVIASPSPEPPAPKDAPSAELPPAEGKQKETPESTAKRSEKLPQVIVPYNEPVLLPLRFVLLNFLKKWWIHLLIATPVIICLLLIFTPLGTDMLWVFNVVTSALEDAFDDIGSFFKAATPATS